MAERELQQSPAGAGQRKPVAPAPSQAPGARVLGHQLTLGHGQLAVASAIDLMNRYPEDRDEMMAMLHDMCGNSYVQQVVAAGQRPEQQHWWKTAAQATADGATLLYELDRLTTFHPLNGTFEGTVDLAAALRMARLIAPKDKLPALTLGAVPKGGNQVFISVSVYHKTAAIIAPQIQVAGFSNNQIMAGACVLSGLTAHATSTSVEVEFAKAKFEHVTFFRNGQHLMAAELEVTGMHAGEANNKAAAMSFTGAHVHGLKYPNAPVVDFDMPGGGNFDAVWNHVANPAANLDAEPNAAKLPTLPDVLPTGSRITVQLVGAHGVGGPTGAGGGFERLHAAVVQGSTELASLEIEGFDASGSTATGGAGSATIRQFSIAGDPALVTQLVQSPQIANNPSVKAALDLVRSAGLEPSAGGHVTGHNLSATHAGGVDTVKGDFEGELDVPQLGSLVIRATGLTGQATSMQGMSAQFGVLTLSLRDRDKKELGFLELTGGAGKLVGQDRQGAVKQLTAHGDLGKLVAATNLVVKHAPADIRGALGAIKALGVSGSITGSLEASAHGDQATFGGDFDALVDVGSAGSVKIRVAAMHGTDAGTLSFGTFTASLKDTKGHDAAGITISGATSVPVTAGHETAVKAKRIQAHGEDATVSTMIAALQAKATTLPAPVNAAFTMVRRFYANAGGTLTLDNVSTGLDKAGHGVARAAEVHASFALHGAGSAAVTLKGFRGTTNPASTQLSFGSFDAILTDTTGAKAAHVRIDGSHDTFAAAGKAGTAPDFSIDAKSVHIDGNTQKAAALFAGIRTHLATLPQPIAASFRLIEQYASSVSFDGTIDVSNAAVTSKRGAVAAHGTIEGHAQLPEGTLTTKLVNARTEGSELAFDAFEASVKDAKGKVAASVHAANAVADLTKKTGTLGALQFHGDAAKLRALLDPAVQRAMPQALAHVLANLDGSEFDLGATNFEISRTATGGTRFDARTLTGAGTVEVHSASGHTFTARGAQLALDGAEVINDANGKVREIDVTALSVRGTFTGAGEFGGDAVIRSGAAKILLDDRGAVTSVQATNLRGTGEVVHSTKLSLAPATPGNKPTKQQQLEHLANETASAETVAQAIRSAEIRARVPMFPGKYGHGLASIGVPVGAAINIAIEVRDNALTNETSIHINPALDLPLWLTGQGVDLETKGREGALKARIGGFFDQNITKYVVGKGPLALDLPGLVEQVTGHMREGILEAGEPKADDLGTDPRDAQPEADRLAKDHASWQKDHDRDAARGDAKRLAKDATKEPRGSMADLASKGIDLPHASASAEVTLGNRSGSIAGHLHGAGTGGGRLQLSADALHANLDGNLIETHNFNTGEVEIDETGNEQQVRFTGLSIGDFSWSRK